MFYWTKTNKLVQWLFHNQIWFIPNTQNKVFLTFDDGPTPEITPWVLDVLRKHNVKATFFCIGQNIQKYPELFQRIIAEGHSVGNHTHNHVLGWKTSTKNYLKNIEQCQTEIAKEKAEESKIFRPPYGKLTPSQSKATRKLGYKIIMWDILSADFDSTISPQECFENSTNKVESGSIIVFHDSVKAFKNLQYALPKAIDFYKEKGLKFDIIS
ncbi:polysaccharide deacetylase family protein [Flavobacterium luminosum]|uniref:Polysaccharide deacetylase family protein n=1 Tax=Flavobacterium luminosum TaxID=2949086 RepID=A0ABT0TPU2_9FLAO|nr:polysaccharide deacetylase family protein [Flavobacterium sp. HXWNR70]MCL9809296.1 polysaccharide deacetylase family protein [Flavobacterium sp. HXWNR70]